MAMEQADRENASSGLDVALSRLTRGDWLGFLPAAIREPAARAIVQMVLAAAALLVFAPWADVRGEAYLEATFARTLALSRSI